MSERRSLDDLEARIAELETRLRAVGGVANVGKLAAFSEGSCTNGCTGGCTDGCTGGCTGGCVARREVDVQVLTRLREASGGGGSD
ncbi:MAG TPA: hypothetical protein VFQ80_08420 [Thermomicrobiales bacterium]|jgi:hypothetical protein|nr:hypothetical protein [Thermomicrobiales bacterium]